MSIQYLVRSTLSNSRFKKSSWMLQLLSSVMHSRYHKRLGLYRPSTSTLLMRSTISCSVICRRSPFMTVISSLLVMQPSLSLSNSANASRNSLPTIHTHTYASYVCGRIEFIQYERHPIFTAASPHPHQPTSLHVLVCAPPTITLSS